MGASAGGLEALTELLQHLPPEPNMALVLIQHLDPHHESALAGLLSGMAPRNIWLLGQESVNELNGHRAFAHGRGNAFDAAGANVADGENAWETGLEQVGRSP